MILKSILNLNIDLYLSDLIKGCLTILALEILWDMIKTLCFYEKGWFVISSYKGKNSYIWESYFHGFKTRPDKWFDRRSVTILVRSGQLSRKMVRPELDRLNRIGFGRFPPNCLVQFFFPPLSLFPFDGTPTPLTKPPLLEKLFLPVGTLSATLLEPSLPPCWKSLPSRTPTLLAKPPRDHVGTPPPPMCVLFLLVGTPSATLLEPPLPPRWKSSTGRTLTPLAKPLPWPYWNTITSRLRAGLEKLFLPAGTPSRWKPPPFPLLESLALEKLKSFPLFARWKPPTRR